jgi:hypothetical protein
MFAQPLSYTKPGQCFARPDVAGAIPYRAGIVSTAIEKTFLFAGISNVRSAIILHKAWPMLRKAGFGRCDTVPGWNREYCDLSGIFLTDFGVVKLTVWDTEWEPE